MGAANTHQHAAKDGIQVARPCNIDSHGIGGLRVLAHRPQIQAITGFVKVVPAGWQQEINNIGHHILIEDGADDRQIA